MKKTQKLIIIGCGLLIVLLVGFLTFYDPATLNTATRSSGKALIGGQFTMLDHDSKTVTDKDFAGKYKLMYFGYTYCPDICPTELQVITGALEQLGDFAKKIQPVFVSIDPERDTPAVMKDYVANFYPGMVGLTGTPEQVSKIAKIYRVYYSKVVEKDADKDDYAVDHSSIIYLMGPNGGFVKHFSYGTDAGKLAQAIKAAITAK